MNINQRFDSKKLGGNANIGQCLYWGASLCYEQKRMGRTDCNTSLRSINRTKRPFVRYLGRKLVNEQAHDTRISGVDHLVRPGYSWWTLGYILTLKGAKKLLAPKPLGRFVPVDEYIPIMFDEHPE